MPLSGLQLKQTPKQRTMQQFKDKNNINIKAYIKNHHKNSIKFTVELLGSGQS